MSQSAEAKLHELRNKTNRELVSLISNKLDRVLAFARLLDSDCGWGAEEDFAQDAEKTLQEAGAWMGLLQGAPPVEIRHLESKIAQLRHAIDRMRLSERPMRAAC